MADYSDPKRGVAFRWNICLVAQSTGQIKTTPTIAAGDFKISKDNGATANLTTLPSEAPAGSGNVQLDISATEMTADLVKLIWIDAAGDEWNSGSMTLGTSAVQMADLATAAALTVVDDFLDTEIAAIKAKTDNLPSDPADASDIASSFSTVNSTLSTIAGYIDTEVSTIVTQTSAASIRTAVGLASANLDTQIATLATAAALAAIDDYLDTEVAAILAAVDTEIGTLQTSVNDLPTNAELATALAAADDAVLAAIAALNNLSAAQINAEVVDALATDTYAEPGQGAPGATVSLATKVNYLYAALRNKSTVTATEHRIFADDGSTVIVKRTLSDDATTFTSTELATGA